MFSKVYSGGLRGIDGYVVQVEADVSDGLPGFYMVGSLASEVREAEEWFAQLCGMQDFICLRGKLR